MSGIKSCKPDPIGRDVVLQHAAGGLTVKLKQANLLSRVIHGSMNPYVIVSIGPDAKEWAKKHGAELNSIVVVRSRDIKQTYETDRGYYLVCSCDSIVTIMKDPTDDPLQLHF